MNELRFALLAGSLLLVQALIGGTRLLYAIPAYALLALASVTGVFGKRGGWSRPHAACIGSAVLLAGWVIARALTSPVPYLAWPDLYMVTACLLAYGLVAWFLTSPAERLGLVWVLLLISLAEVAVGLRQFSVGDDFMLLGFIRAPYGHRASGFFVHSISLAGHLEVTGALALSLACWSRWRLEARIGVGFIALLSYLGVAISGSRGGYLASAFSIVIFGLISLWLLSRLDRGKFLIALVAGSLALALLVGGATALMSRSPVLAGRLALLQEQFSGKWETRRWDIRRYNWQAALDQFHVSPLTGTGSGTHLYYGRLFRRPPVQSDPVHAHSDYLELLAEYGVIGGAVMALFLGAHLFQGLRMAHTAVLRELRSAGEALDNVLALQVGLLASVAAYLVHSAVDFNLHVPGNALLLALVFGMLANPRPSVAPAASGANWRAAFPRFAFPLVALTLLGASLPKLAGEYWAEEARRALRDHRLVPTIEASSKALAHEQRNPDIYFYRGEAFRGLGLSLGPRLHAVRAEQFTQAVGAFERGLAIFPQDEALWLRKANALESLRRLPEAETAYETAVQLDPNLGVLHAHLGAFFHRRGREEEAAQQIAEAQRLTSANLAAILQNPGYARDLAPTSSDSP